LLAGRAAEELIFNEVTTGAQSDIKQATEKARQMVTDLGMSDKLGPRTFGDKQELIFLGREISEQRDYGDKIADAIDDEVNKIIRSAHRVASKILSENRPKLRQIAEALIVKETLEGDALEALFNEPVAEVAEAAATPVPSSAEPAAKTRARPAAKKPKASPRFVPKQAPASG